MCVCRITEIRNRTGQITEEIRQLEQDSEDAQGKSNWAVNSLPDAYWVTWASLNAS